MPTKFNQNFLMGVNFLRKWKLIPAKWKLNFFQKLEVNPADGSYISYGNRKLYPYGIGS